MRKAFLIILVLLPGVLFAQLDIDGKTGIESAKKTSLKQNSLSILLTPATIAPFGIKLQYCNSFGGYVSFKTSIYLMQNYNIITGGISKSISKNTNLYLGGGVNIGVYEDEENYPIIESRDEVGSAFEFGILIKNRKVAFDIGIGTTISVYEKWDTNSWNYLDDYTKMKPYLMVGLGFNF
jgi:hypothetical protein